MTVNKQTSKVIQDGFELTWHREGDGEAKPEDVAQFYVDTAKALQKFKEEDPRTQPELRKAEKKRKSLESKISWMFFLTLTAVSFYHCGQAQRPSSPWSKHHRD